MDELLVRTIVSRQLLLRWFSFLLLLVSCSSAAEGNKYFVFENKRFTRWFPSGNQASRISLYIWYTTARLSAASYLRASSWLLLYYDVFVGFFVKIHFLKQGCLAEHTCRTIDCFSRLHKNDISILHTFVFT